MMTVNLIIANPDTMKCKLGIYNHTTLAFSAGTIERSLVPPLANAWYNFTFTTNPVLPKGDYILCAWWNANSGGASGIYYANGDTATQGHHYTSAYAANFPTPFVVTHIQRKYSIYATYTPLVRGTVVPKMMKLITS